MCPLALEKALLESKRLGKNLVRSSLSIYMGKVQNGRDHGSV